MFQLDLPHHPHPRYHVDTSLQVVPAHDPEYTWDAQEGNNSCFHRIKSNQEDKEPPTEATDKTQVCRLCSQRASLRCEVLGYFLFLMRFLCCSGHC